MKILLHACCGPCAIMPVQMLRDDGFDVMGFYYRHNIHPYTECLRRQEALTTYADTAGLRLIVQEGYEMERFIRNVAFRESERCTFCYYDRMRSTALVAKRGKFDFWSTTLLYSKFQKHEKIREIGESVGKEVGIRFHYVDFRTVWKEGIEASKRMGLYRQQYCGCIYSEKDRYFHEKDR